MFGQGGDFPGIGTLGDLLFFARPPGLGFLIFAKETPSPSAIAQIPFKMGCKTKPQPLRGEKTMDFETALHDDLGNHYQRIMRKYKNIAPEQALQAAATLTAAQTHATYLTMVQGEINLLRRALDHHLGKKED